MTPKLTPNLIMRAYCAGIFPMGDPRTGRVDWYTPDPRGIIPLSAFRVPRSTRAAMRRFRATSDREFEGVIDGCAARPKTWISREIRQAYVALHRQGHAHSIETWAGEELAGGVYGVHIRGAFMAESMFYRVTEGGKVALALLLGHLKALGVALCDIQMVTPHTARFGAVEVSRAEYLRLLDKALQKDIPWKPL
jgi:leucyl/phenylalanyl-tRNA--protein transferase